MFKMNSILTIEERTLLQSLGCADKEHAISVIEQMIMPIPIVSELFGGAYSLKEKLEGEYIDFAYEMTADEIFEEEIA